MVVKEPNFQKVIKRFIKKVPDPYRLVSFLDLIPWRVIFTGGAPHNWELPDPSLW